jgi:hypothetical protein
VAMRHYPSGGAVGGFDDRYVDTSEEEPAEDPGKNWMSWIKDLPGNTVPNPYADDPEQVDDQPQPQASVGADEDLPAGWTAPEESSDVPTPRPGPESRDEFAPEPFADELALPDNQPQPGAPGEGAQGGLGPERGGGGRGRQGPRRVDFGVPQQPQGFLSRWASNPLTQFGLGLASAQGAGLTGVAQGLQMGLDRVQAQKIAQDKLDRNYKLDTSGDTTRLIYPTHAIDTTLPTGRAATRLAQQQQRKAAVKPSVIGEDKYGRKIYGIPDPNNPTGFLDPVTGKPVGEQPAEQISGQTAQAQPQQEATAAEETIPSNAVFAQGFFEGALRTPEQLMEDPATKAKKNPAILQQYPEIASEVMAMSEGRTKFPAKSSRNTRDVIIRKVLHDYDPTADETLYARRQRTAVNFASGVEGRNLTAANTFGQHLGRMDIITTELNNSGVTDITSLRNTIARHGGSVISKDMEKLQNLLGRYDETSKALGDEGAKVFAGGPSALADRQEWHDKLPQASDTVGTAKAKLSEMVYLIDGRIDALATQYNKGMNTKHNMGDLLAPKTRETFDKVRSYKDEQSATTESKGAGAAPAAAPAAQAIPPADKREVGKVYPIPGKGDFEWLGNGWRKVK